MGYQPRAPKRPRPEVEFPWVEVKRPKSPGLHELLPAPGHIIRQCQACGRFYLVLCPPGMASLCTNIWQCDQCPLVLEGPYR